MAALSGESGIGQDGFERKPLEGLSEIAVTPALTLSLHGWAGVAGAFARSA